VNGEWTAAAGLAADTAAELGFDAALTVARAWRANCLPEATRSLTLAARALTSEDARMRFFDKEDPWRTAADLLGAAEEHEAQAAAMAMNVGKMAAVCENARDHAIGEHERAARRAAAAASDAELGAARETMQAAMRAIGDCDAALELIAQVSDRLRYAARCFSATPAEFADAYDVPLQFVHDGGTLPWSGDFLAASGGGRR